MNKNTTNPQQNNNINDDLRSVSNFIVTSLVPNQDKIDKIIDKLIEKVFKRKKKK